MLNIKNGIAIVEFNNPPVNSLGHPLRSFIIEMLEAADLHPDVHGVVLVGNDKAFSAGADVSEFGTESQFREPILKTVIAKVRSSEKPIVAAISGVALGGGFEIALACDERVTLSSARVGFPEVNLGLIPGSGGTQFLPRLIGLDSALSILLSGKHVSVTHSSCSDLFLRIVETDVLNTAIDVVNQLSIEKYSSANLLEAKLDTYKVEDCIKEYRSKLSSRQNLQPAYGAILDAVLATSLSLDEGLKIERSIFMHLLASTQAQALRYLFKSQRVATRMSDNVDINPRQVKKIAVIGAGTMGSGIAISAIESGFHVLLLEQNKEALDRGKSYISSYFKERIQSGKIKASQAAKYESCLSCSIDWENLNDADMVIEAVFEDIDVKQEVFRKIDSYARPGAVLATNTSYLDVDAIATSTRRPQDVLGLHFFSPANVMKLLEVVEGKNTAPDVLCTGMKLGLLLNKTPVLCGNSFGFIGNRIYNAYRRQCEFMLEDGAWPEDVDQALIDMGFAMGPFAVADLSGLDIAWRMRKAQASTRDPRERYVSILDSLCEKGRLGRKTGAGYYSYVDGKKSESSDDFVRQIISDASLKRGIQRRILSSTEIQRRALLAMVNEAVLLLMEGVAKRAEDIDVVLAQGYGFPRWEGGPIFWARHQNLDQLKTEISQLAKESGFGFVLCNLENIFEKS